MDTRRHAPLARARAHVVHAAPGRRPHSHLAHKRRLLAGISISEHVDAGPRGHVRWLLSTCLVAAAGLIAILAVAGKIDINGAIGLPRAPVDGLPWSVPKADKLLIPGGAMATSFVIEEPVRERRDGHDYIFKKRYQRVVARLSPISRREAEAVPRLDSTRLYATTTLHDQKGANADGQQDAEIKVIELLGGTLAMEDGQHLDIRDVAELVARLLAFGEEEAAPQNTSLLLKSVFEADDTMQGSGVADRGAREALSGEAHADASSLYASLYHIAARHGVGDEAILQILKIHAFQTDFSQKVRPGDALELFFEEDKGKGELGALLATALTASGTTHRFYRFRTPDGTVDYYDGEGNTSRTFLLRRPVRCEGARLTSGFGMRRHPLLQVQRMHWGEDWACAAGTPVMAAGSGVVEEAGRKGEFGNYVRIRHADGYQTAYGHMSRFATGVSAGAKVRQGDIIGYVSTTGLSSGPHVHFEVMVKSVDGSEARVDPSLIRVAREHQLGGNQLAEFKRERDRIDVLTRRNPVSTQVTTAAARF